MLRTAPEAREIEEGERATGADRSWRWMWIALAVVPPLTFLARVLTFEPRWRYEIYADDAFYYFGVARNIVEGHGSTVTGLVSTNGYHPLWMALLVPLAAVFRHPEQFVLAVAVLEGVLWALAVREIARIGRIVGSVPAAAGALVAYGVLTLLTGRLAFIGMESAVLLPLLLAVVRRGLEAGDDRGDDLKFGLLLALACLARLDAVFALAPIGLAFAARAGGGSRAVVRRAAVVALPGVVVLATYVLANEWVFDTPSPVSGQAKGLGGPFLNRMALRQVLQAGNVDERPLYLGVLTAVALATAVVTHAWRRDEVRRRVLVAGVMFGVGQAILVGYLVVGTSYPLWPWYHYLLPMIGFCAALILVLAFVDRYGERGRRACLAVAGTLLVAQAVVVFLPEDDGYPGSLHGAAYVERELPADAVLAMGDRAGIFGYLADRPLLHLEGLTADAGFLGDIEQGDVVRRMATEGVDYYVRYGPDGEAVDVDGRSCQRFYEPFQGLGPKAPILVCDDDRVFRWGPDGDSLSIWRFRPDLNGV